MTPDQVAKALLQIADGIEKSKKPQVSLVAQDISKVISEISASPIQIRKAAWRVSGPPASFTVRSSKKSAEETCRRIAGLMMRLAEDEELGPWDLEEGERTEDKWEDARKETSNEEKLESKLKFLKRQIDKFISAIKSGEEPEGESEVFTSAK
jgi:hypothetical protein